MYCKFELNRASSFGETQMVLVHMKHYPYPYIATKWLPFMLLSVLPLENAASQPHTKLENN